MQLKGYVRVTNNSGEDYENAQVRLIVGKVHILDQIADLARRQYPYGRPGEHVFTNGGAIKEKAQKSRMVMKAMDSSASLAYAPKQIVKEGLN